MRIAIVSDLHANLQAWNATLLDIRCNQVDRIICLGDIVGYGPQPAEVLKSVHANVDYMVLGNHDAVVCGKLDADLFNDDAKLIIEWTQGQLNNNAVRFLKSLPLSLASSSFRCTHGDFSQPEAFHYVIDPQDALPSWEARDEQLLFVGHSHMPGIFLLGESGTPHLVPPQEFVMEAGKRYLVNPGSIGQPRDGEPRASYCIFDGREHSLSWRRIPFDMDTYRAALSAAQLPSDPSYFLRHDPREGTPPIRELLSFSPPASSDQTVQDTIAVQDMEALQKCVSQWKGITALVVSLFLLTTALVGVMWSRHLMRARTIEPLYLVPIMASSIPNTGISSRQQTPIPPTGNLLVTPQSDSPAGTAIDGWSIHMGNRYKQSVLVRTEQHERHFVLYSDSARDELRLVSHTIKVNPQDRFRLYAELQRGADFCGDIAVHIEVTSNGEPLKQEWQRNLADVAKDGWLVARRVFPPSNEALPSPAPQLRISIQGAFTGHVALRNLGLGRLE